MFNTTITETMLDVIINNPGLEHISLNIFMMLDHQSLLNCRKVNQSWKKILDNPRFWLKRIQSSLSSKDYSAWKNLIQKIQYLDWEIERNLTQCLIKMNEKSPELFPNWLNKKSPEWFHSPFRTSKNGPNSKILESQSPLHVASTLGDLELVTFILDHQVKLQNPNLVLKPGCQCFLSFQGLATPIGQDDYGYTSIHRAALYGHCDVVKVLAQHTKNPNAPNQDGLTPIHLAAMNGHTEVVKFLVTYTETPNAPDTSGVTPYLLSIWNREAGIDTRRVYECLCIC